MGDKMMDREMSEEIAKELIKQINKQIDFFSRNRFLNNDNSEDEKIHELVDVKIKIQEKYKESILNDIEKNNS
jgi:hypothetical protein